jgi:hypothetical protein
MAEDMGPVYHKWSKIQISESANSGNAERAQVEAQTDAL